MFYVLCPYCHGRIEIAATANGPDCSQASNLAGCDDCGETFFFEGREVAQEQQPEAAA